MGIYDFIHCDSTTNNDGVGIYIKQTLPNKQKFDINIKLSFVENIWIEVKATGVINRHPTTFVNDYEALPKIYVIFLLNYGLITLG